MQIAKRVPDKSSKDIFQDEFDVLCGIKSLSTISSYLPQDLYPEFDDQNTVNWLNLDRLVESFSHTAKAE